MNSKCNRRKIKKSLFGKLFCLWMMFCFLFMTGCIDHDAEEASENITVSLTFGDCKSFQSYDYHENAEPDCLDFFYDDDHILWLVHRNAGFNCCPGQIVADVLIEDKKIIIKENETESACLCLCLFDVHYQIQGLQPGTYTVFVYELYTQPDDEPLTCTFDFYPDQSDSCCVDRNYYPWVW